MLVTPNFKEKNVIVEQVGSNPSAVNGVQLRKGEKRKARHDDIIEVLESRHFFKLEFTPHPNPDNMGDNRPSCSRESQPSTSQNGDITESKKNMETRGSLDHFLKDSALQAVGSWKKMTPNSLLVFSYDEIKSREKVHVGIQ